MGTIRDMSKMLNTEETAGRLELTPGRVRQLARKMCLGYKFGARAWAFTGRDVARMQARVDQRRRRR